MRIRLIAVLLLLALLSGSALAGDVVGQVVNQRGAAVAGATVQLSVFTDNGTRTLQTRTNDRGVFTFELNRYEGRVFLHAAKRGVGMDRCGAYVDQRGQARVQMELEQRPQRRGHRPGRLD